MKQKSIVVNISRALTALAVAVSASAARGADEPAPQDLTALPFEQLLSMEVYSASRYVQKASEAPASVTVISAADIRDHGWRTLGAIARSVRGMYVSYDRNYSYLGERGFLRPGDYNTRFLLQVDGNRINDSVYDQAPIGNEFPLDLDLIDRIEFVPGPGSSIYGSNAFFGVINVITKQGGAQAGAVNGTVAALEAGSAGARKGSLTHGWSDAGGGQYLLSASRYRSAGNDLYYPEFDTPEQNNGVAHNLDYERGARLFASATRGALSVSLMHGERTKGVPTASFGQPFNDPHSRTVDRQSYLSATLHEAVGTAEQLTARVFWGSYDSFGDYVIKNDSADALGRTINRDGSAARWGGAEVSVVSTRFAGHTLLAGADLQRDYRLHQYSFDIAPYASYLDTRQRGLRAGVYVQDEVAVGDALLVNAGVRFDHNQHMAGVFSPRLALIYTISPDSTIKAIQGSAFRAPNSYEMYYAFDGQGGQEANPDLHRERVSSTELVWTQRFGPAARMTATAFRVAVNNLITQALDVDTGVSQFNNAMAVQARGVELEYERSWQAGAHLRTSYSYVSVGAAGQQINAPIHLAKFNLAAPLGPRGLRGAIESQYVGKRRSLIGEAGAFWLVNANLVATSLVPGAEVSLGVYNLLGRRYADPASTEHVQANLAQDGRNVRLRVAYGF